MRQRRSSGVALRRAINACVLAAAMLTTLVATESSASAATPNKRDWYYNVDSAPVKISAGGLTLTSTGGVYTAKFQTDGNFVVYHNPGRAIWASNSQNHDQSKGVYMRLNATGIISVDYLCEYGCPFGVIWKNNAKTSKGPKFTLIMQADGNLVEYVNDGAAIWATNTVGR